MTITIIIPVFNGAEFISACIQSCLNQSYKNIEILIINDGSRDNTEEILKDFELKDKRIRHITQNNVGLVKSRKNGVKNTTTDYFIFLDADDTLSPNAIEKLVEEQKKSNCDLIFANFTTELANDSFLSKSNNNFQGSYEPNNIIENILKKNISPTIWGKLISTSFFKQIDVPDNITIGEDAIAIAQLLYLKPTVSSIKDSIYHYIQRENSMVNNGNSKRNQQRLIFMEYFQNLILERYGYLPETERSLKRFMIGEVFDILRDGGSFSDVKEIYFWITRKEGLFSYKSLGIFRLILIKSFKINDNFGKSMSWVYNKLRSLRSIFKYI